MPTTDLFLPEWDQEMDASRRVLERVPEDHLDWKPHEKSMSLGHLAAHVAEIPTWTSVTLHRDGLDFDAPEMQDYEAPEVATSEELMAFFEENASAARDALASTSEEAFDAAWCLTSGGETLMEAPRREVFRRQVLNHMVHHRGQLTLYLRLLDVPVPQTFGPTADEPEFHVGV